MPPRFSFIKTTYVSFALLLAILGTHHFMTEDTNDPDVFWGNNGISPVVYRDIIDENEWNRLHSIKPFSFNTTNSTSFNSTHNVTNNIMKLEQFTSYESFLRSQISRMNAEQTVRNLDQFDLRTDGDGIIVIIIQVASFSVHLDC